MVCAKFRRRSLLHSLLEQCFRNRSLAISTELKITSDWWQCSVIISVNWVRIFPSGSTIHVASSQLHSSRFRINFCSLVLELCSFGGQSMFKCFSFCNCVLFYISTDIFGYFHAAEMRAAHEKKVTSDM